MGNFPWLWSEWNGKFRDTVRDYWAGEPETLSEFAERLMGSSDMYEPTGRRPYASINFVTAHDGFTLRDLVSYRDKHNDANGEGNSDGSDDNRAWNCGVEGETDDPAILSLRARQVRNLLATRLLSQGVPMLVAGDELGRTQRGNNNAYCQDNEISWLDWSSVDEDLFAFTRSVIELRQSHPVFHRRNWFQGRPIHGVGIEDCAWFQPSGEEMSAQDGRLATLGRWASSSTALSLESTTAANVSPMTASCCCSMPITNPLSSVCRTRNSVESGTSRLQRKRNQRQAPRLPRGRRS